MALQLGALREALISAGAPPDKADKAAEEVAAYETQLAAIRTDLTLLKWMTGTLLALSVPAFWLLIRLAAKGGVLS